MSGGWAGSDRLARLPINWPKLRNQVHKRSEWKCEFILASTGEKCGRYADGGVDHIIRGDNHSLDNLRDTCAGHHRKKSSAEGNAARAAKKAPRRAPEKHPGRIQWTSTTARSAPPSASGSSSAH